MHYQAQRWNNSPGNHGANSPPNNQQNNAANNQPNHQGNYGEDNAPNNAGNNGGFSLDLAALKPAIPVNHA